MNPTILSTLVQVREAGTALGAVSPAPVDSTGAAMGLASRVEEVSLRSLLQEAPEESFATLMERVSLGPPEECFRSIFRAAEPIFRKKNSSDSPVDSSIREEIGTCLILYGHGSPRSADWAFSESQFHRAVMEIVWNKVSHQFLSLPLTIFERKFNEIFEPEIDLLRKFCTKVLEEELRKEGDDFFRGILERQSDPRSWILAQEDLLRVIGERHGGVNPSWIIDIAQIRMKARIIFNEVHLKHRTQGLDHLKKTAEHWIREYYEETFICWNEEQEESIPDFKCFSKACTKALRGYCVEDFIVRDTLRVIYEDSLNKRPSDYLNWLVERKYIECRQMPEDQVIAMCEVNFCRRFLVEASTECHDGIVAQYKIIKEERIKRLQNDLRNAIELHITREIPPEVAFSRKSLGQVIASLLQERFLDAPLTELQIREFVFHTYIGVMVNEKNREFGLSCDARTKYPFIFPDKIEPLHQMLYSELLRSIALHMEQDFIPCYFCPPGELPGRIKKVAHDALNNCLREASRKKVCT
jgi:hypothetical protein